jgi:hypothetical protein
MIPRRRRIRGRWAAALALFAILLQSLLPALHHPAGMTLAGGALAGGAGSGDRGNLCGAPGGAGEPADHPQKSPSHPMPACAICQAVHAIGGFAPPPPPALTAVSISVTLFTHRQPAAALQRLGYPRQRARAPPLVA